jgi:hypothetical protein
MRHRPREPVKLPNYDTIKATPVRIGHETVQGFPFLFSARDSHIHVLAGHGPAAALGVFAKLARLHRRILSVV